MMGHEKHDELILAYIEGRTTENISLINPPHNVKRNQYHITRPAILRYVTLVTKQNTAG